MLALVFALAAPDYLTSIQSEVIQAPGSASEIAQRGETCMARTLAAGVEGGEVIISSDPANGVVVARNALRYQDGFLEWQARSRVTFEARDGRFRIEHTSIERFNDQAGGWTPIGKWRGSGWAKAETAFKDVSAEIARCVQAPLGSDGDDW